MRLLGLDPLALALLVAAVSAVVIALHLVRRPERTELTPLLFLWKAVDPEALRERPLLRRMRRVASLLLALALALALAFALGDPERARQGKPRDWVLLIDNSASMDAHDVAPSRLAVAKQRAKERARALRAGERALVASFAADVVPRSALSGEVEELLRAIDAIEQTDAAADLGAAIEFAVDVLGRDRTGAIALYSDGNGENAARASGATLVMERVGEQARNVAIVSFSVRRYPLDRGHHETLVTVHNFGADAEQATLRVLAGETPLAERRIALSPGASATIAFGELPLASEVVEARIALDGGPDYLASDDRAFASVPPRPRTRVLAVASDNRFLEAALLLDEYLDVVEVADTSDVEPANFDVAIVDGSALERPLGVPTLYLGEPASSAAYYPVERGGVLERPYFDRVDRSHPLVTGLALEDVNIARAVVVRPARGDRVIGGSERAPLLIEGARDETPFIALPFDVRASDLPLRPAWPLLVLRALDRLSGEPPSGLATRVAGEAFPLRVRAPSELIDPDGRRRGLSTAGEHRVICDRAGIYHLANAEGTRAFAVSLPADREGAIAPRSALPKPAEARGEPAASAALSGRWWSLLVALALALAIVEWATFHRRWST